MHREAGWASELRQGPAPPARHAGAEEHLPRRRPMWIMSALVVDEIKLVGSRCGPFAPALRLMAAGLVDPRALITETYPMDQAEAAFARAATERGVLKVLLKVEKQRAPHRRPLSVAELCGSVTARPAGAAAAAGASAGAAAGDQPAACRRRG